MRAEAESADRPIYISGLAPDSKNRILEWQQSYSMGISLFDEQHKELIRLINDLYAASQKGWSYTRVALMRLMRYVLDYFQMNMIKEERIMERIGYPGYREHKREHVAFLKEVLVEVTYLQTNQMIDIKSFILFLRDWILSHVGICDKKLGLYLVRLKKEGNLNAFMQVDIEVSGN
ncbi:MAG: bacteriohemerythrin [Treponema sp.]|nr:bacteriohemerythrin [Treponema sp.]